MLMSIKFEVDSVKFRIMPILASNAAITRKLENYEYFRVFKALRGSWKISTLTVFSIFSCKLILNVNFYDLKTQLECLNFFLVWSLILNNLLNILTNDLLIFFS